MTKKSKSLKMIFNSESLKDSKKFLKTKKRYHHEKKVYLKKIFPPRRHKTFRVAHDQIKSITHQLDEALNDLAMLHKLIVACQNYPLKEGAYFEAKELVFDINRALLDQKRFFFIGQTNEHAHENHKYKRHNRRR